MMTQEDKAKFMAGVKIRDDDSWERIKAKEQFDAFSEAGFPARHVEKINASWPQEEELIRRMLKRMGGSAIIGLCGPRGHGKTQLACCLSWRLWVKESKMPRYIRAMDVIAGLKSSFEKEARIEALCHPTYLVIDECHEVVNSEDRAWITLIVDRRYGDEKSTVLISNHQDVKSAASFYGASISSRTAECGGFVVLSRHNYRLDSKAPHRGITTT